MAAYTTADGIYAELGQTLVTDLIDLDENGGTDTTVLTAKITQAGAIIDAYCGMRYSTPFAAITATPDTPDLIQWLAVYLVCSMLLKPRTDMSAQRKMYWDEAMAMLEKIQASKVDVPDGSELSAESQGVGFDYDDIESTFASHDDDLEDHMEDY